MTASPKREHPRLAVLIGAPHEGEVSMHNDLAAMHSALLSRGLAPDEILSLEGKLDRQQLMTFLEDTSQRMAQWSEGDFFLYLSGHGFFTGETVKEARVGIQLERAHLGSNVQHVFWEEAFSSLSIPEAVTFTMLIDH
jgi:hypothetical protein